MKIKVVEPIGYDAYSNEFTIEVGCPTLVLKTIANQFRQVPDDADTQAVSLIDVFTSTAIHNPAAAGCTTMTFKLLWAADDSDYDGTQLSITAAGILKVNQNLAGAEEVIIEVSYYGST